MLVKLDPLLAFDINASVVQIINYVSLVFGEAELANPIQMNMK